ncbi:hypothetical protein Halar_0180 (plasmid) [halophilic archaeon DL31]|jgi:ribosomal protein L21E|nr:hypothetical protein Halar_0180 [halophilic archaeon DL31]
MQRISEGDRVRIDTPDETGPDHQKYHGKYGEVVAVLSDDADSVTAEERGSQIYRIAFDSGETADFRWRDLRSPLDDSQQA